MKRPRLKRRVPLLVARAFTIIAADELFMITRKSIVQPDDGFRTWGMFLKWLVRQIAIIDSCKLGGTKKFLTNLMVHGPVVESADLTLAAAYEICNEHLGWEKHAKKNAKTTSDSS